MTTQAQAFCRQAAVCGGSKITKEQFQQLVPQLLCQISNTGFLGFLCDPTDGLPVFLQAYVDPGTSTVELLAFTADGTPYLEDLSLLETCGGGSGPGALEEINPEALVSLDATTIDENYSIAMTSVNGKKYISVWNTSDQAILISNDGTVDFQIVGANQNLKLDLASDNTKWSTDIWVRAVDAGTIPAVGTLYFSAYY